MIETREEVAHKLMDARPERLSYGTLSSQMFADFGIKITGEQLRLYHQGTGPEPIAMNVEAMRALSIYYAKPLRELSVTVDDRWKKRLALVGADADPPGPPEANGRFARRARDQHRHLQRVA